jgi:hypothetical protein
MTCPPLRCDDDAESVRHSLRAELHTSIVRVTPSFFKPVKGFEINGC